jgi:hypothetical protein
VEHSRALKKIHSRNFLSAILLIVCLSLGCVAQRQIAEIHSGTSGFQAVAIGLCEDYPEESRSLAGARRDLEVLATNDIHVLRIAFGWDAMEPEPDKYDWNFWDDFVRIATDEYGIQLIPYVCYTPKWVSSSTNEDFFQQPPRDNAAFAEFVKQLVTRYKDRIHSWEIWNEPDNSYYWRGSVGQFANLLQAGASAVREADPSAKVVLGGLAWNPNFLEAVLTNSAAIQNIDVINLHNYYETWASEPLEHIPDYVGHAYDLIHQHGQHQPIWLAEAGYSSFRSGDFVSGQYQARYLSEHTPQGQAVALFRTLTLALASGKVSLVAWYRINDLPETQAVLGDVNNRHLGILDEHGRAKPALRALQFFHSLIPESFRCLDGEIRVSKEINSPAEVHAFENTDGHIVVAAWLRTYVPGADGNRADSGAAKIDLDFPFRIKNSAQIFDESGNKCGNLSVVSHKRTTRLSNLHLSRDHVTVLTLTPAAR